MDTNIFLIFITGFFLGMIFLRWISNKSNRSDDKKKDSTQTGTPENDRASSPGKNRTRL